MSRGVAWRTSTGLRWFVRVVAFFVALVNSCLVILWLVGGLYVLGGVDESSLGEALPSLLLAVIAGLAASEIVLRGFGLLGRGFSYSYQVVIVSVCLGGAIEGGMLSVLYAIDGTLFPAPPPSLYAHPFALLGALFYILLVGLFGVGIGLGIGLAEGLVLGLPLAAALGTFGDSREPGGGLREVTIGGISVGAVALGTVVFVAVAAIMGYAVMAASPPPQARAIPPPALPSCPEYLDEKIATFEGSGNLTTRNFEVSGYWGYEYASTGYGNIGLTVVDGHGDELFGTEGEFFLAGNSAGGGEYAAGGTFRLQIDADDDAKYAVVVCDGAGLNGRNRDNPG